MMKRLTFFSFLLTVTVAMGVSPQAYPYRAVVTVGMVADLVRNVGGDLVEVEGLIGEGVDPHLYKPTRGDVVALSRGDILFYNGLYLEGKMADVLERMGRKGTPVVAVGDRVEAQGLYPVANAEGEHDPHIWMDVRGWMAALEVVTEALKELDPVNADAYDRRSAAYRSRLEELDTYARDVLGSIPEGQRVLVTAHDAFYYLGRAYGIEVRGIQGISTESEAGVRDIENLIDFLSERGIPAIFVETSVSDKNVRALVEGARARGHDLRIGGSLFSDAMGPGGTYEGTYIGMIDHNVTVIARALGGDAPVRGFQGKLNPDRWN